MFPIQQQDLERDRALVAKPGLVIFSLLILLINLLMIRPLNSYILKRLFTDRSAPRWRDVRKNDDLKHAEGQPVFLTDFIPAYRRRYHWKYRFLEINLSSSAILPTSLLPSTGKRCAIVNIIRADRRISPVPACA